MTRLERNAKIAAEYNGGRTMSSIIAKWGLTSRQIYRILQEFGISPRGWQE